MVYAKAAESVKKERKLVGKSAEIDEAPSMHETC